MQCDRGNPTTVERVSIDMTTDRVIDEGAFLPDVPLVDHAGEPFRFSDHRGRPLVLVLHRHLA